MKSLILDHLLRSKIAIYMCPFFCRLSSNNSRVPPRVWLPALRTFQALLAVMANIVIQHRRFLPKLYWQTLSKLLNNISLNYRIYSCYFMFWREKSQTGNIELYLVFWHSKIARAGSENYSQFFSSKQCNTTAAVSAEALLAGSE